MHHPLLGELVPNKDRPQSVRGTIRYDSREISLDIESDDKTLEVAVSLAVQIVASLPAFDAAAKAIVAKDLLETYNSGWNEYDETREDGTFETVRNPRLAAEEFQSKFTLNGVNVCGDRCVDLWYEDGGLFWGHSIYVSSLDGADFTNAQAQLFG
jgi:hypothetical protein